MGQARVREAKGTFFGQAGYVPQGRCEICGGPVMGCEEDDGCRATRLCKRHYWLMVEICEPSDAGNTLPSKIFGSPSASESEKIVGWFTRWSAENPKGPPPLNCICRSVHWLLKSISLFSVEYLPCRNSRQRQHDSRVGHFRVGPSFLRLA